MLARNLTRDLVRPLTRGVVGGFGSYLFSAPSATWISDAATAQAIFEILVDPDVVAGMKIFGESSQQSDFSVIDETVSAAIGAPDLIDFQIDNFAFAPFTDGTWYARFWTATSGDVQNSPKSTAISETIVTYSPALEFNDARNSMYFPLAA